MNYYWPSLTDERIRKKMIMSLLFPWFLKVSSIFLGLLLIFFANYENNFAYYGLLILPVFLSLCSILTIVTIEIKEDRICVRQLSYFYPLSKYLFFIKREYKFIDIEKVIFHQQCRAEISIHLRNGRKEIIAANSEWFPIFGREIYNVIKTYSKKYNFSVVIWN